MPPGVYAIAAMSENRVIGNQGKIPWHLADDFRWFKHKTMGGNLLMGRKTYESIGKPLPGRKTWVVSRTWQGNEDYQVIRGHAAFADLIKKRPGEDFWICGGAEIYDGFLHEFQIYCQYLYLTTVKKKVEGDAFFPKFEDRFTLDQLIHDQPEFKVERWRNKKLEQFPRENSPPFLNKPDEVWPFLGQPT